MNFLKNRSDALTINKSNKNDIIKLIGLPHSKSVKNEDKWIYFERVITRGKLHKLGQNVLKTNNILELTFDEYGILVSKTIYDKSQMNNIEYSKQKTENTVTQKSFVNKFLSSIKQKMYGGKRK
jgi:outer membrane protein assembly factor BamE (lipoprotein component of BamABCDE complex)